MAVDILRLNDKKISYDEIKSGDVKGDTPFEQSTLWFIRQWLNGQGLFSLKTSGSTGEPKPITVSRYQMRLSAQKTIDYFELKPEDTVLVCLNTAYIAGIMMLVRALISKANIIAIEPTGNPLVDLEDRIDFLAVVPLQLQQILGVPKTKKKLEKCRSTIVGGAPVSIKLDVEIGNSGANIYATFGMTETLTHFALKRLNPDKEDFFTSLEGVTIGQDARGCLTVASLVTEEKALVTNDLVEILSHNTFKWLGRVDNVINSGGVKLQIEELESKIGQVFYNIGLTNRFIVGAFKDEALGEKVVLIIESEKDIDLLNNVEWSNYLNKYEKPKQILFASPFIETPTGKVDKKEIVKKLQN